MLVVAVNVQALQPVRPLSRRRVLTTGTAGLLGAEAGWAHAVAVAAAAGVSTVSDVGLPADTVEQLEAGRIVAVKNWLSASEVAVLLADAEASFAAGHFKADALASYGRSTKAGSSKGFDASSDRMVMPSFYPSKGYTDGPWVDASIGNAAARQRFKQRMGAVKLTLSRTLQGRASLAGDARATHEMSYTRYGPGAFLARHTDEHHAALKRGQAKPAANRRSVSWLVYLNQDWHAPTDGGELRVHERRMPAAAPVGARGDDLQLGWLKATATEQEEPVFLDDKWRGKGATASAAATATGTGTDADDATCMLYTCAADGTRRQLSTRPFAASPALYIAGGDLVARKLLLDSPRDAARFHLVDAPKSAASAKLGEVFPYGDAGEDRGERVRDIAPDGGTLVLFDSVSLPHEVLPTRGRERFACSGWFHEDLGRVV